MGKTFKKVVLSVTGEFGSKADKFRQWVEANGGRFSKEINDEVTHLLATKVAYKKNNSFGTPMEAPYLDLSALINLYKQRPKREGPYLWARAAKEAKKKAAKEGKEKAAKEPRLARDSQPDRSGIPDKILNLGGHHLYIDSEKTSYIATLTRSIEGSKSKERHILKLFESDNSPHTYAVFAKYTRPGRVGSDYRAPLGSSLATALDMFNKFFLAKTGKTWSERNHNNQPEPKSLDGEGAVGYDDDLFQYVAEDLPSSTKKVEE